MSQLRSIDLMSELAIPQRLQAEFLRDYPNMAAWTRTLYEKALEGDFFGDAHLLPLFEPRRIVPPAGYHSPKTVAAQLYMGLGRHGLKHSLGEFAAPLQVTSQALSYEVINAGVPIYYVDENLARAVAATELPDGVRIGELEWPAPAMAIGFPVRFMQEYVGLDLCYILAANCPVGTRRCPKLPGAIEIETTRSKATWMWMHHSSSGIQAFTSAYHHDDELKSILSDYVYTDYMGAAPEKVAEESSRLDRISALMLKLLCVLNWREGLVRPAVCVRPRAIIKRQERPELWAPNIIGHGFRIASEVAAPGEGHASPRVHFRRGHTTWQAIGQRADFIAITAMPRKPSGEIDWTCVDEQLRKQFYACHRRLWIAPVLVGIDESA